MRSVRPFSLFPQRSKLPWHCLWAAVVLSLLVGFWLVKSAGIRGAETGREDVPDSRGSRPGHGEASGIGRASRDSPGGKSAAREKPMHEFLRDWENVDRLETTERGRRHERCKLIEAMVAAGHYECARALALKSDEGLMRQALVHSLFSKTTDLESALSRINEEGFTDSDRNSAWSGLTKSMSREEGSHEAFKLLKSGQNLSDTQTKKLISGAISYMDPAVLTAQYYHDESGGNRAPDASEQLRRLDSIRKDIDQLISARPELEGEAMQALSLALSFRMPRESLSIIEKSYFHMSEESLKTTAIGAITTLFSESPAEALSAVAGLQDKIDCAESIGPGMTEWLTSDSKAALEWLKNNGGSLNSDVLDKASSTAVEYLLQKGRAGEAEQLAERIVNPGARDAVREMILGNEAERYLTGAKGDLAGHLDSLTGPESTQPAFYIEKTFGYWIENEPSKAQAWYEKNWNSLDREKAQFIAAAYALDAARLNDPDSASHWMQFIRDEKMKKRIQQKMGGR